MRASTRSLPKTYNASVENADDLVRLHLSESPFGASPAAVHAVTQQMARVNRYPDPNREQLVAQLAHHWGVSEDKIAVANGSDELILATALTLGRRTRSGLVTEGTFPGYQAVLERIGRGAWALPLCDAQNDTTAFADQLPEFGIGYVCNPHNPTGSAISHHGISDLISSARSSEVPLVFDEAYHEFGGPKLPQAADYLEQEAPVIALRTFSKAYGLAALRIGYAIGRADLIAEIRATLGVLPFSVNRLAQAAASAALTDQPFLNVVQLDTAHRRHWFCTELDRRGYQYLPSETNFVSVRVNDSAQLQDTLAKNHGILVRDTGMFGLPSYLRVSLGTEAELLKFLDGLAYITSHDATNKNGG